MPYYHVPVHIATASRHHHTSAAGNFCHLWLVSNTKSYQAFKAKDHPQGQYTVSSGTLNSTIPYHTLKVWYGIVELQSKS